MLRALDIECVHFFFFGGQQFFSIIFLVFGIAAKRIWIDLKSWLLFVGLSASRAVLLYFILLYYSFYSKLLLVSSPAHQCFWTLPSLFTFMKVSPECWFCRKATSSLRGFFSLSCRPDYTVSFMSPDVMRKRGDGKHGLWSACFLTSIMFFHWSKLVNIVIVKIITQWNVFQISYSRLCELLMWF